MALGMIAGALASVGTEALASREEKKARDAARPKRRRLAKLQTAVGQAMNNKQRALIAMAQAHQNFASTF